MIGVLSMIDVLSDVGIMEWCVVLCTAHTLQLTILQPLITSYIVSDKAYFTWGGIVYEMWKIVGHEIIFTYNK